MTRVLVFGTFDRLHPGHEFFLKAAASLGDELWVVVPPDPVVQRLKGHFPKESQEARLSNLLRSGLVHKAVLGDETEGEYKVVKEIGPDIIFLGYDQEALSEDISRAIVEGLLPAIRIQRGEPHKPDIYHTSLRS